MYMTDESGTRTMIKHNCGASEFIPDTESTLIFTPGQDTVTITVRSKMLPGLRYWSRPSARTMRQWIDELIADSGYKRAGRLEYRNDGPITTWLTDFTVTRTNKG